MNPNHPSLIAGLDPAALFGLSADDESVAGTWQPPTLEEAAKLFPSWQVLGLLGRGGMGAVYHVRQPDLDREVAVKLLPIEASRDERQVERFRREARTLAKLKHPGIVALHEAGMTPAGHFFFVMEYIDGHPLSDLIAQGKMDVPRAIDIVRQVCDALAYAHGQGVVHRDIKPSNILIDALGQAKVADFGLAHWDKAETEGALSLSRTGMFMGTPAYTAPEQARDATKVDHRADIYSLGVLLYELLTGELPRGVFQPPSRKAGTDAHLDNVVQRALQERPEDRYQAASELKQDVTAVGASAATSSQSSPRRFPWAAVLIIVMVLGAGVMIGSWLIIRSTFDSLDSAARPAATRVTDAVPSTKVAPPPKAPANAITRSPAPIISPSAAPLTGNEKQVTQTTQPVVASPASMSARPSTVPVVVPVAATSKSTAKVWSINPLSPKLSPPDEVMKLAWKDCVLLNQGGAVLLEDGQTLYTWHESDAGVSRSKVPTKFVSLHCNSDYVGVLDASNQLWSKPLREISSPSVHLTEVLAVTSSTGSLVGIVKTNKECWLSPLRTGEPNKSFPYQEGMKLAITSDNSVFALNSSGVLTKLIAADQKFVRQSEHTNLRNLFSWGQGVLVITADERVEGFDVPEKVPDLQGITEIVTGEGFAIARDWKGRLTIWGSNVPDSPQRLRMPEGTTHLTASPLGLIAVW